MVLFFMCNIFGGLIYYDYLCYLIETYMKSELLDKIDKFFNLFKEINKSKDKILDDASQCDKDLSALYHEIEGMELGHVATSHNKLKELQVLLRERRKCKGDKRLALSFTDGLSPKMSTQRKQINDVIRKHDGVVEEIKERAKPVTKPEPFKPFIFKPYKRK